MIGAGSILHSHLSTRKINLDKLPRPVSALELIGIEGLFTDVDDTLTQHGKLSAQAYQALWQLREAGVTVVPVTGRSYGWAHMMLSQWPINAVIAESGGVYLYRDASSRGKVRYFDELQAVTESRQRLMLECARILSIYPELRFASDNALRQVDVAIDYCEDIARVPIEVVEKTVQSLHQAGFQARYSTVHINAWYGKFDKGPMALRYLGEVFGLSSENAQARWAFIGDAPNDQSMFDQFPKSAAVANIQPYLATMQGRGPTWITHASHGDGFIEFANALLESRYLPKT
jgi:HAD superfamily hydrolase (TIGR01484 family)